MSQTSFRHCAGGPPSRRYKHWMQAVLLATLALVIPGLSDAATSNNARFTRVSTFPVFLNNCNGQPDDCIDNETVSEIVASSRDGMMLIYTDSPGEKIGFVDISDPSDPQPAGLIDMGGEPTSVAVSRDYALVAVNTSPSFVSPSGQLKVIHIPSMSVVRTIELGGQPDAVSVSPNNRYAAIAIENERNEDACAGGTLDGQEVDEDDCEDGGGVLGGLPQSPAGFLVIVDLIGAPSRWTTRKVSFTGVPAKFPSDPEVEFVDINAHNVAAVTLQENNHIVLVHLPTGTIVNHFSAGTVDLTEVDTDENSLIEPDSSLSGVPREPDAVTWISPFELATTDEGDLDGGSRGFTVFRTDGSVRYASGNSVEHLAMRIGHYNEDRSENKGAEPEGIEYALFGSQRFLFVGPERSSFVAVYSVPPIGAPELVQVLPAGVGHEGLHAIPGRNLLVVSSEEDSREDTVRANITIYELQDSPPNYPTIISNNRLDGTPLPWGALSALTGHPTNPSMAYTVYDSFYDESRIFPIDVSQTPAVITGEIVLTDRAGGTFHFDPEGIAARPNGAGFWVASEGSGSCTNDGDCSAVASTNLLLEVASFGRVLRQISLPASVNALQRNNGYEGVASTGTPGVDEKVYVAFQREWVGDPAGMVRIGCHEVASGEWTFFYYPIGVPESPNGGWIGLSEIVAIDDQNFAVLERDNLAGTDARVKKIYRFSIARITPQSQGSMFPVVRKTLVRDIMADLASPKGLVIEKVEGLGVLANGEAVIVTDNDGVDGSSGETQFQILGWIF